MRQKCLIASQSEGNVLILPREGGYLFRMYVELDKLNPDERVANRNLTQHDMIAAANRIMAPYTIDVKEVVWWSIYEIGHRLTDRFDDVTEGADRNPRVFTAGDACHTHSAQGRARDERVDAGRVQPRLETRPCLPGPGRCRRC